MTFSSVVPLRLSIHTLRMKHGSYLRGGLGGSPVRGLEQRPGFDSSPRPFAACHPLSLFPCLSCLSPYQIKHKNALPPKKYLKMRRSLLRSWNPVRVPNEVIVGVRGGWGRSFKAGNLTPSWARESVCVNIAVCLTLLTSFSNFGITHPRILTWSNTPIIADINEPG